MAATAMTAPARAAWRVPRWAREGSTRASSTVGKAASSPKLPVLRRTAPASTPSTTATFQHPNSARPQVQNVLRRRPGSCWRMVNATDSSVINCAPSSRVHHLPPTVSATVKP